MVLSREQGKIALEHVISNVFGISELDAPLWQALKREQVENIADFMTLSLDDICNLKCKHKDKDQESCEKVRTLPLEFCKLICA